VTAKVRFAVVVPNVGGFADASVVAALAHEAEDATWDGFFVWDTIEYEDKPVVDPWIALTAAALATRRVVIGPLVASAARRRPWKLAREALSLDQLSRGRLVLGLGAGYADSGFTAFGEDPTPRLKAERLEETIALLDGFFSGRAVRVSGAHFRVNARPFLPRPVRGEIPIWIALSGRSERQLARAARVDGALGAIDPDTAAEVTAYVAAHRRRPLPFDLVMGVHERQDRAAAHAFVARSVAAGATWIRFEVGSILDSVDDVAAARAFIRQGPPRDQTRAESG
jgi:alkanesulfonate monooxygenase SsuD/methylene tetrahydromethanopterin reductase-like flavin-dependent oxidoreductase (luciferase family)